MLTQDKYGKRKRVLEEDKGVIYLLLFCRLLKNMYTLVKIFC